MAKEATIVDPLVWLKDALDAELAKVEAIAEYKYSSSDRGSLTINRNGKAMQTSYFSSHELQSLRDGGVGALEKQKQSLVDQIHRLLNPPRPQPISLTSVMPARRGRTAAVKKGAETDAAAAAETDEAETAEPAEPTEPAERETPPEEE